MKKKFINIALLAVLPFMAFAQPTISPAKADKGITYITNATIHVGNGNVIQNGTIKINNGKIEAVGNNIPVSSDGKIVDANGQQVYPGLILTSSSLGLVEVPSVRATADNTELGEFNPNIRTIVAYNADSRVVNTLKSSGILLANIVPENGTNRRGFGGTQLLIAGSSSVVQLDAWNWEDAAYETDKHINFYMPSMINRMARFAALLGSQAPQVDPVKQAIEKVETVKAFFREAKAYNAETVHAETNLKFESVKGLFTKKQKLFVHCDIVKEMLMAADFVKEFGFDVVIVGGTESYLIPELLKENNMSVILGRSHQLPTADESHVDQPYKTAGRLQKAGVLFAINDDDDQVRGRNLPFNAGTAAAYGLTKEEALAAITLNAAKILGIENKTGSIEVGKDANIVISAGDILDMRSSIITNAFIQGRQVSLDDVQKQLYEKYKQRYGLK